MAGRAIMQLIWDAGTLRTTYPSPGGAEMFARGSSMGQTPFPPRVCYIFQDAGSGQLPDRTVAIARLTDRA